VSNSDSDKATEKFESVDRTLSRRFDRAFAYFCSVVLMVSIAVITIASEPGGLLVYASVLVVLVVMLILAVYFCADMIDVEKISVPDFKIPTESYETSTQYEFDDLVLSEFETKPIPGVAEALSEVGLPQESDESLVKVLRGGEFVGNRMRLKVKVLNDSPYLIADVTVYILTYPHDALKYSGNDHHIFFSKIEPSGFRSPTFDFLPTQDCVKGEIVAGVSYIDEKGKPHTMTARPFVIRAVCDLLLPQRVTSQDFELKLKDLDCGEILIKIDEWTPEEMFDKALKIVDESNFFEVSSLMQNTDDIAYGKISGFAQGKYTGKEVGVEVLISGPSGKKGASCTIRVSGEDQAMILPAIDDLKERLSAWLCPMCSSPLTLDNVAALREGKVIECPFCAVSIGR
jgi:hypothetical protein